MVCEAFVYNFGSNKSLVTLKKKITSQNLFFYSKNVIYVDFYPPKKVSINILQITHHVKDVAGKTKPFINFFI